MNASDRTPALTRLVEIFLRGDVAILLIVVSLLLGGAALVLTPREEEPQIIVPLADVIVSAPGLSAVEVEQQVTNRLERLLYQIDGVEYVYSMSRPGECVVTVRFYVGEDREDSLVKLYNKINSNVDLVPPVVTDWVVKPIEIDDVPIVIVTLWSETPLESNAPTRYDDHDLRRIAEELRHRLQAIADTNRVEVVGGRPRRVRVDIDAQRLAAHRTASLDVVEAIKESNVHRRAGRFEQQDEVFVVEAGTFVGDKRDRETGRAESHVRELEDLVIAVADDRPVRLADVATIRDGPAEPDSYTWIGFGPEDGAEGNTEDNADDGADDGPSRQGRFYPAVHLAVAKRKGSNAVRVARAVERELAALAPDLLPDGVHYRITRDYGETANDKVNELVEALVVAVISVVGLIGLTLGWRAALVVALAIPVCYSLTLFVNLLAGYTINRVTMFALILALGLLVDDPITDVENIARYFSMRKLPPRAAVLRAIQEVRPALILSTLAIIVSFLPMSFITGMMGPYMGPMALNVPLTVTISTVVAFVITPWLAMVALRPLLSKSNGKNAGDEQGYDLKRRPLYLFYKALFTPLLARRGAALAVLAGVGLLLVASCALPLLRMVPLKMLPYDNKNELQLVIDMPEGTTLERTDAVTRDLAGLLATAAEVRDVTLFSGLASPMDFNGMVRHYFLRRGPHVAEIRVTLAPKERRRAQSHAIALRLRKSLARRAAEHGANVKLVEVPPGPPVLATITAEVYGPHEGDYVGQIDAARSVATRLGREPDVVDVDTSAEDAQVRWVFETDKAKAALSGVSTDNIARTLELALGGTKATVLHLPREIDPLWIELRLPRERRSATEDLAELYVRGRDDQIVQIGALGRFRREEENQTIYHKNLRRVVFVYAEVAGRPPADAIVDVQLDRVEPRPSVNGPSVNGDSKDPVAEPRPLASRTWLRPGGGDPWSVDAGYEVEWAGEGEWKITLDVFRDLGLAFAAALGGIFVILMFQTGSRMLPLVIMLAIPLTLIGIMPGFWLLQVLLDRPVGGYPNPVFITATAMIGMIALAGIVVRNSVVLIDFIHLAEAEGVPLSEAIVQSVAIRTRPILLTAGTTLLGNIVITLDPIFSGLAWSIIFGILTSTLFTLLVIPLVYWMLYGDRER